MAKSRTQKLKEIIETGSVQKDNSYSKPAESSAPVKQPAANRQDKLKQIIAANRENDIKERSVAKTVAGNNALSPTYKQQVSDQALSMLMGKGNAAELSHPGALGNRMSYYSPSARTKFSDATEERQRNYYQFDREQRVNNELSELKRRKDEAARAAQLADKGIGYSDADELWAINDRLDIAKREYDQAKYNRQLEQGYQNVTPSNALKALAGSLQSGYYNSAAGVENFKKSNGLENNAAQMDLKLQNPKYKYTSDSKFVRGVLGSAELIGQQAYQATDPKTIVGTGTAALAGGLAGGPAAALAAGSKAYAAGSALINFEVEAGMAYKEMVDNGIDPKTASIISKGVGGANALLEYAQIDDLMKAFKILPTNVATEGMKSRIAEELMNRGVDVANNVLQEMGQEGYTMAGAQIASLYQNGKPMYSMQEVLDREIETGASSLLTFGVGNAIGGVTGHVANRVFNGKANPGSINVQTADDGTVTAAAAKQAVDAASNELNNQAAMRAGAAMTSDAADAKTETNTALQALAEEKASGEYTATPDYRGSVRDALNAGDSYNMLAHDMYRIVQDENGQYKGVIEKATGESQSVEDPRYKAQFVSETDSFENREDAVNALLDEGDRLNWMQQDETPMNPQYDMATYDNQETPGTVDDLYEGFTSVLGKEGMDAYDALTEMRGEKSAQFVRDFSNVYSAARYGRELNVEERASALGSMNDKEFKFAYDAGLADSKAEVAKTIKAVERVTKSWKNKKQGTVDMSGISKVALTNKQKTEIAVWNAILTKGFGLNVKWFNDVKKDGTLTNKEGSYTASSNTIEIGLHAGAATISSQVNISKVVAHELTHWMQTSNAAMYESYKNNVIQFLAKSLNVSEAELVGSELANLKKDGKKHTKEEAEHELVARASEDMMRGNKEIMKLFDSLDANTKITLADHIKETFNKIKKMFNDLVNALPSGSREAKLLRENQAELERLQKQWTDTLLKGIDKDLIAEIQNGAKLAKPNDKSINTSSEVIAADHNSQEMSIRQMADAFGYDVLLNEDGIPYQMIDQKTGKKVTEVTEDMVSKTPIGNMIDLAVNNKNITTEVAKKQRQMFADLMNMVIKYNGAAEVWAFAGSTLFSSIKKNSDKQYGTTVDFGTICSKTQAIVDVMSKTMLEKGRGLTRAEVIKVYNQVANNGLSVPCPVCYVFSRWMGVPSLLETMRKCQVEYGEGASLEKVNNYVKYMERKYQKLADEKNVNKADDKKVTAKDVIGTEKTRIQGRVEAAQKKMQQMLNKDPNADISSIADEERRLQRELNELEAYNWVTQVRCKTDSKRNPIRDANGNIQLDEKYRDVPNEILLDMNRTGDFASKYAKSWTFRTTRGAGMGKAIMPYSGAVLGDTIKSASNSNTNRYVEGKNPFFNGDIKKAKDAITNARKRIKAQNLIGGQRFQSTSDYRAEWGLDYMMTFLEMQAIGAKGQLYTKVIEAVDLLASSGCEVNLSIMGKGKGWHVDANGNKVLDFSSVTGIDYDQAYEKTKQYDNVQMILVGLNDEHIRLALEGTEIQFVIPWHSSGSSEKILGSLMSAVNETLENGTDYSDVQSDKEIDFSEEKKAMRALRKAIVMGKAKTLNADQQRTLDSNPWLQDLYNRFYVDKNSAEYGIKLNASQATQIFPYEYWDKSLTIDQADMNGYRFQEYCASLGISPRFSGAEVNGEIHGDFTHTPGYWKLLIDRRMYNRDGTYHEPSLIDVTGINIDSIPAAVNSNNYQDQNAIARAVSDSLNAISDTSNEMEAVDYGTENSNRNADGRDIGYGWAYNEGIINGQIVAQAYDMLDSHRDAISKTAGGDLIIPTRTDALDGPQNKTLICEDTTDLNVKSIIEIFGNNPIEINHTESIINEVLQHFGVKEVPLRNFIGEEYFKIHSFDGYGYGVQGTRTGSEIKNSRSAARKAEVERNRRGIHFDDEGNVIENSNRSYELSDSWLIDDIGLLMAELEKDIDKPKTTRRVDKVNKRLKEIGLQFNGTKRAAFTDERIKKYLSGSYYASTDPKYAQAYITYMSPIDYLKLTAGGNMATLEDIESASDRYGDVDFDKLGNSDPIYLSVSEGKNGFKVVGHEGRHRMYMLGKAGFEAIPVLMFDSDTKYSKEHLDSTKLEAQKFYGTNLVSKARDVVVNDVVPFSSGNTDEIINKFGSGAAADVEYSNRNVDYDMPLVKLAAKYGAIPKGYKPLVDVTVPRKTSDNMNVRQFTRTVLESGIPNEEMSDDIKKAILDEALSYEPISDKASMDYAIRVIKHDGLDRAEKLWAAAANGRNFPSKNDIAIGEQLLKMYADQGNSQMVLKMTTEMASVGTQAGQVVQAFSMLKKLAQFNGPTGASATLVFVQKEVDRLNDEYEKRFKGKKNIPHLEINKTFADEYLNATTEEEREAALGRIYQDLGNQVPSTIQDKLTQWRMLAMLGNPRTHIRNILGNAVFMPAIKMKNVIAQGIETAHGGEKTKSLTATRAQIDFAKSDFQAVKDSVTGGVQKADVRGKILENRKVFKTEVLNKLSAANSNALETEDRIFLEKHYVAALSQYMNANHIDPANIDQKTLNRARVYAINEAQKATYRDASAVASYLNQAKNIKGLGLFVEGVLPFKKTPINILKRGIEYSPVGLIKSLSAGSMELKKGNITFNQWADDTAAGLSGTAIMALGMFLFAQGVLRGGLDDDDDKDLEKLEGKQNYAIELFGKSYTVDWATPVSMPLFVGAEMMKQLEQDHFSLGDALSAMELITEPMFNLSMLDGLNSTIEAVSYSEHKLTALGAEVVASFLGQFVPTIAGQFARTVDDTRRINYTDKNSELPKDALYFIEKTQNKIPVWSMQNDPYVDQWGREDTTDNILRRAFENFISPGYLNDIEKNPLNDEIRRLNKETGENVNPKKVAKYFGQKEDRVDLTSREYHDYQQAVGTASYNILSNMIDEDWYQKLSSGEQVELFSNVYKYANYVGRKLVQPEWEPTSDTWIKKCKTGFDDYKIPVDTFIRTRSVTNTFTADKNEKGNSIPGSKKAKVHDYIDSLNLNEAQKEYLKSVLE